MARNKFKVFMQYAEDAKSEKSPIVNGTVVVEADTIEAAMEKALETIIGKDDIKEETKESE